VDCRAVEHKKRLFVRIPDLDWRIDDLARPFAQIGDHAFFA
jgi:hypothetical protein